MDDDGLELLDLVYSKVHDIKKGGRKSISNNEIRALESNNYIYTNTHLPKRLNIIYHQSPWSNIAAATFLKPAMLLPATRLGNSPSAGSTYSFAVSSPFLKHDSMMSLSLSSTSSDVHAMRCEFWAISRPETATPPALAALPVEKCLSAFEALFCYQLCRS